MSDFKDIFAQMAMHDMPTATDRIAIAIPNAGTVLEDCFKYFLSVQNIGFVWQPEYDEVAKWLGNNEGRGLFLYGDCGRGKSILSRYVIPAILLKYMRKVVRVYDVQAMNKNIDEVLSCPMLSLDDIGTEDVSNTFGNKRLAFAEVMDAVEKYSKLVIVSTNLKGSQLTDRYGVRTMDRVIATTKRIEFKGKSLRQ